MNILGTQKLTDYPHLNLFRTRYEDRHGEARTCIFASRRDPSRLMSNQWEKPDAVVIVPFHTSREMMVIIKEYRVVLGDYQYGFPAGLMDPGESVADTCRRELFEETGLTLGRVRRQSPPVYSSSGITDESVSMVYVECDGTPSRAANESSEDIQTVFVGPQEAAALCANHDLRMDVKTWVVLSAFAQSGRI